MSFLDRRVLDKYFELPLLAVIISCIVLSFTISSLNDAPYYKMSGMSAISDISYDSKQSDKVFSSEISLKNSDSLQVYFKTHCDKPATLTVDLYDGEKYDEAGMELSFNLPAGDSSFSDIIPYYRTSHPDNCQLRFIIISGSKVDISNIILNNLTLVKGGHETVWIEFVINLIVLFLAFFLLIYAIVTKIRKKILNPFKKIPSIPKNKLIDFATYILLTLIITVTLAFLYRNAFIYYPLQYSPYDEMGGFYFAKMLREGGLSLTSFRTGGFSGTSMYDVPYSDLLFFLPIKLISIFTDNPYLTINIFYFLCFYMIAFVSYTVFKHLHFHTSICFVLSILYSFSPFIQRRYYHIDLVQYYTIPIMCYIGIITIRDALDKEDGKISYERFYKFLFLAFICSQTSIYYGFFACIIFATAWIILIINKRNVSVKKRIYPLGYILSVICGIIISLIPNFIYWFINGTNSYNDISKRSSQQAEIFALRFIQMILPQDEHRIHALKNLTQYYNNNWPFVNENYTAALGLIAVIGFVATLIMLLKKDSDNKELSFLNVSIFCIATIGGLSSVFAFFVTGTIRSYNRLSLAIMFISLAQIAVFMESLRKRISPKFFYPLTVLILIIGLFDQTYTFISPDYSNYESDRDCIKKIESLMPEGSMIFQLPSIDWPSGGLYSHYIGFLESDNLKWSFPSMQGREEACWQKRVTSQEAPTMISELKKAGYDGIYLDINLYGDENINELKKYAEIINDNLGKPTILSNDGSIYFWKF